MCAIPWASCVVAQAQHAKTTPQGVQAVTYRKAATQLHKPYIKSAYASCNISINMLALPMTCYRQEARGAGGGWGAVNSKGRCIMSAKSDTFQTQIDRLPRVRQSSKAHPVTVMSNGKVMRWGDTTGGMWSFLSLTAQMIVSRASSTAVWSFAWRLALTASMQTSMLQACRQACVQLRPSNQAVSSHDSILLSSQHFSTSKDFRKSLTNNDTRMQDMSLQLCSQACSAEHMIINQRTRQTRRRHGRRQSTQPEVEHR